MSSPERPATPAHAAAAAVTALLAGYGLTRIYVAACQLIAVISVSTGLTAWTNARQLWVTHDGQRETWPAAGPGRRRPAGRPGPPSLTGRLRTGIAIFIPNGPSLAGQGPLLINIDTVIITVSILRYGRALDDPAVGRTGGRCAGHWSAGRAVV
jgi:hypothetical protein